MRIVTADEFRRAMPDLRTGWSGEFEEAVRPVLEHVRKDGDNALLLYTERFDGVRLATDKIEVTREEVKAAWYLVDDGLVAALTQAHDNVMRFHRKALPGSWTTFEDDGTMLGQIMRPLDRVGVYVPGGTASYPSSVIMAVVPAKVAGVREIVICTPPGKDGKVSPLILVAADICGVNRIFRVGGAQAIGAMAYGTETVPRVNKIVGPGNAYVTAAKRLVFGFVDIDMLAGPSEVIVIADGSADPDLVASDLIAQAEHDTMSHAVLVTDCASLAFRVNSRIGEMLGTLPRREIATKALDASGFLVVVRDLEEAVDIVNVYGPEHVQIMVDDSASLLAKVRNAGAVFVGRWSPVAAGDYCVGPNHILPTGGSAASFGALSTSSFVKITNFAFLSRPRLLELDDCVLTLAHAEGLAGHAMSVQMRRGRS